MKQKMKQITVVSLLAAALPTLAVGCTGVTFFGHFAVVAVTLGIFVGTLSLNKRASDSDASSVDRQ